MNTAATKARVTFKNILYATDFSPAAESALPYVKEFAKQYGATVHALHVRMPATYPIVGPEAMPQIIEAAEELAELELGQLNDLFVNVPHDVSVIEGELWPVINEIVEAQDIDLIVIGTHGRTGIGRALLGSTAEEIFRKARCPVLTVGPHITNDTARRLEMKEILYATDFSAESLSALPIAVSLAEEHQARLTILNVIGESKAGDLVHPEHYTESTMRQLRQLVPAEADKWCEPRFKVERGPAANKILEAALAFGADLIVLGVRGTHGGTAAATHVLRPTAHRIVTEALCPVLTVRG